MATFSPQIQAVLCDMDGTLSDTEVFWQQAERRIIAEYGDPTVRPEATDQSIGISMEASAALLRDQYGVTLEIGQLMQLAVDYALEAMSGEIMWMPGILSLLDEAETAGIPRALVTSSPGRVARAIVAELPGQTFDVIIPGDDVSSHKPEPAPYLHAAQTLGADPRHCVAFEDSVPGMLSALAAGCLVVGASSIGAAFEAHERLIVRPSLEGLSLRDIADAARAVGN